MGYNWKKTYWEDSGLSLTVIDFAAPENNMHPIIF